MFALEPSEFVQEKFLLFCLVIPSFLKVAEFDPLDATTEAIVLLFLLQYTMPDTAGPGAREQGQPAHRLPEACRRGGKERKGSDGLLAKAYVNPRIAGGDYCLQH